MAARALAAFEPGAWLSTQDIARRIGARPWLVAPNLYSRLWRRGWVEQIDDPNAKGRTTPGRGPGRPRKLWRLTALGEFISAAVLEGAVEDRPPVLDENPKGPRLSARKRRRRRVVRRELLESRA